MMTKTIYGRVLCGGKYHRISKTGDQWDTPGCPDAVEEARRIAGMAALGGAVGVDPSCGCAQLVALCMGLPRVISRGGTQVSHLGVWRDLYVKYESNGLVVNARRTAIESFEAAHHDTLSVARRSVLRATSYWYREGLDRSEILGLISFVPDQRIVPGTVVALDATLDWEIPLQEGWLEHVGRKRPVVGGRFVVGVGSEPGRVYAIDRSARPGDHSLVICEYKICDNNRYTLEQVG